MIAPGSRYSLTLGDAFELVKQVPSGSVDLILTDPPYDSCFSAFGIGDRSNGFCRIGGAVGGAPSFDMLPVLEELPRICTPFNAAFSHPLNRSIRSHSVDRHNANPYYPSDLTMKRECGNPTPRLL